MSTICQLKTLMLRHVRFGTGHKAEEHSRPSVEIKGFVRIRLFTAGESVKQGKSPLQLVFKNPN